MKRQYFMCVLVLGNILPCCFPQDFNTTLQTLDNNAGFSIVPDLEYDTTLAALNNHTTTTVNQPRPSTVALPELVDHRIFYRNETWRVQDGTHDGTWMSSHKLDFKKVGNYYFEHYYPEVWLLRLDNTPDFVMHINPYVAEIFRNRVVVVKTDRAFDVSLYLSVGSVGVLVNTIMLVVMLSNKDLQTPTNILLCSVAVADILYLIFNPTNTILNEYYKDDVNIGDHFCKGFHHISMALYCLTVLHNTAVAFERYLAICWPMKVVANCTKKRSLKIAAGLWVLAFILPIPMTKCMYLIGSSVHPQCLYVFDVGHYGLKLLSIYSVVVLFMFPVALMLFSYISITVTLMRSIGKTKSMTSDKKDDKFDRALQGRMQVIKLLWVICLLFLLSWMPNAIVDLCQNFDDNVAKNIIEWFHMKPSFFIQRMKKISFLNSTMNPLVFFFMSKGFRDHTIRMLTCGKVIMKKNVPTASQMTMSTTMTAKDVNTA